MSDKTGTFLSKLKLSVKKTLQQFYIGGSKTQVGAVIFFIGCFYGQFYDGSFFYSIFSHSLKKKRELGMILPKSFQHFLKLHKLKRMKSHKYPLFQLCGYLIKRRWRDSNPRTGMNR